MRKAAVATAWIVPMLFTIVAISASAANEGKFFFPIDPQVKECWNSFSLIPGCVDELFRSFVTGIIGIGPACCKVINEVGDKCFPKFAGIYPFNPFLAPTIKAHCQTLPAPAPRSSPLV